MFDKKIQEQLIEKLQLIGSEILKASTNKTNPVFDFVEASTIHNTEILRYSLMSLDNIPANARSIFRWYGDKNYGKEIEDYDMMILFFYEEGEYDFQLIHKGKILLLKIIGPQELDFDIYNLISLHLMENNHYLN